MLLATASITLSTFGDLPPRPSTATKARALASYDAVDGTARSVSCTNLSVTNVLRAACWTWRSWHVLLDERVDFVDVFECAVGLVLGGEQFRDRLVDVVAHAEVAQAAGSVVAVAVLDVHGGVLHGGRHRVFQLVGGLSGPHWFRRRSRPARPCLGSTSVR